MHVSLAFWTGASSSCRGHINLSESSSGLLIIFRTHGYPSIAIAVCQKPLDVRGNKNPHNSRSRTVVFSAIACSARQHHVTETMIQRKLLPFPIPVHSSIIYDWIYRSIRIMTVCSIMISRKWFKCCMTTQRLHSFKFTLVNKSHSQHSVVAVCCEGHHFLILYACAHVVSFPDKIPRSLVWERD